MFVLYIFAIIIHVVFAAPPCQDGVEIITQETKNPEDLIGNWTYVYHWDSKVKFAQEFINTSDHTFECPQLYFEAITPELVKAKKEECAKFKIPFDWADAKLKVNAPAMKVKEGVITVGEKENWMAVDCITMVRVVVKKVSDNYITMINPDKNSESELIVRSELPSLEELKCLSHNLDVGKGMSGFGVCYKQ